jgi:hypothetical protein
MASRRILSDTTVTTSLSCVESAIKQALEGGGKSVTDLAPYFSAREELGKLGSRESSKAPKPAPAPRTDKAQRSTAPTQS